MRMRAFVMLAVAVVLGLVSVLMLQRWVQSRAPVVAQSQSTKTVVIAREALAFGTVLVPGKLKEIEWPSGNVPTGSFSKVADLVVPGQDRVVLQPLESGEPVLAGKVSGLGGRATLSTVIDDDKRAITIRVNDVLGVAGFVLPGDRVDVLLTQRDNRDSPVTDILLQNVRVLGIDQDANVRKDQPSVARAVTLEVTPDQGQKLALGASVGTLGLALRNASSGEEIATRTIGVRDLRTGGAPPPSQPVAAVPERISNPTVRVLRGTSESEVEVQRDGGARSRAAASR